MKKDIKKYGVVIWGGQFYGSISPELIRFFECKKEVVSWHKTEKEAMNEAKKLNKERMKQ